MKIRRCEQVKCGFYLAGGCRKVYIQIDIH